MTAPPVLDSNTLLFALKWRYATKEFDPAKKIPDETWKTLEQALVLTPSSYGLQPWKFLVIQNPDLRARLRPHANHQSQVTDCSHFVVFAMRKNRPFPAERKVPGLKVSDANKALTATAPVAPLGSRIVSGAKM